MFAQHGNGIIEGPHIASGASLHEAALHDGEHEARKPAVIRVRRQLGGAAAQPTFYTGGPILEVAVDEFARLRVTVADFECEVANGTTHTTLVLADPLAILI
jgi:hypothetical protein